MSRIHKKTFFFDSVTSTQDKALELLDKHPSAAVLVFANQQTQGRGQLQRTWKSAPGGSVLCTLALTGETVPAAHWEGLYWKLALYTHQFLNHQFSFPEQTLKIKWPNDLYFKNKKLGGLLIELAWQGTQLQTLRIGFGLNLHPGPETWNFPAAFINELTNTAQNAQQIADNWAEFVLKELTAPLTSKPLLLHEYELSLLGFQEWKSYTLNSHTQNLKITGIDSMGNLVLTDMLNNRITPSHTSINWDWLQS